MKYILTGLFLAFSLACISVDFYFIEKALYWADPPIVSAKGPQPAKFHSFLLGSRNFFNALMEEGVSRQDANAIVTALQEVGFDFGALRPKQTITMKFDAGNRPVGMHYMIDKIHGFVAHRLPDGTYDAETRDVPTVVKQVTIAGRVSTSVWNAILDLGEMPELTAKFIDIFGWDIDFSSDTQRGDSFVLILEKIFTDKGEPVGYGRLFAGQYNGKTVGKKQGVYFDHPVEELKGFFTESGQQMKKFMLRAPLNTLRVTSRFGFRMHPTLKNRKMHNGIDYGAPTGTPVWAAADGKVSSAGRQGAAGNMVVIDHGDGLQSYYMHLSRIHVKQGQHVKQKMMIGRVGSTGRSTGPHLHFGLRHKGQWVDPTKRKFGKPVKLAAEHMPALQALVKKFGPELESVDASLPPLAPDVEAAPPEELEEPLQPYS